MPLDRRAMGRDHFACGNLHALTVEAGTMHLELATVRALHRRRLRPALSRLRIAAREFIRGREQARIKCPVMSTARREAIAWIVCAVFVLGTMYAACASGKLSTTNFMPQMVQAKSHSLRSASRRL